MFGSAPAPSPLVSLPPIWIFTPALLLSSAWTSVLATMNSTPPSPTSTMRSTALLPPPPTPTTLMRAALRASGASVNRSGSVPFPLRPWPSFMCSSVLPLRRSIRSSEKFFENPAKPSRHSAECTRAAAGRIRRPIAMRVQPDAHRRGKHRAADVIGQAAHADGRPTSNWQIEDLLGDLRHPLENRPASREHDSRVQRLLVPGTANFVPHQMKDFLGARLQNLRQDAPRHEPWFAAADAGHVDRLVLVDHRRQRASALPLQFLSIRNRGAQTNGDVAGEVIAANGHHRRVPQIAALIDRQVCGAATDIDQRDAELLLVRREQRFRSGQS